MPLAGYKDFNGCVAGMQSKEGYDEETAKKVCGKIKAETEVKKSELQEWTFDPKELLSSNRKVKGIFHKAVIDKDGEYITPDAIRKSIPDYMHLPALHDFHKERPVGVATRIWEEKDGSFGFEGVIKATEDCDDIWEKIKKGNYDHVSIFGRRTEGTQNCTLPQGLRTGPCITNGVRLDSISVCDGNARNDETSLAVAKAQLIWDGMSMIQKAKDPRMTIPPQETEVRAKYHNKWVARTGKGTFRQEPIEEKAETSESSNLMHTATDYPEKKCAPKCTKYKVIEKGDDMDEDVEKGTVKENRAGKGELRGTKIFRHKGVTHYSDGQGQKGYSRQESIAQRNDRMGPKEVEKGDESDDMTEDEVEKGIRFVDADEDDKKTYADHRREEKPGYKKPKKPEDVKKGTPKIEEEPADRGSSGQRANADIREPGEAGYKESNRPRTSRDSSGRAGTMRKGDVSEDDADDENQYDEELDSSKKNVSTKDKEGQWSKDKNPQGSVKVKKAEKEQEIDTETRGKDAKIEEEEEPEDEEVEKGKYTPRIGDTKIFPDGKTGIVTERSKQMEKERREKLAGEGMRNLHKGTVKKGEQMEEEEVSQEYVTKAMVPIEEVDTIVKARTEEISKAYTAQFEEVKKANLAAIDEVKKAYDAKIAELSTKVDKMAEETIRKGGSIIVIPELLDPQGKGYASNADALAHMTAGK